MPFIWVKLRKHVLHAGNCGTPVALFEQKTRHTILHGMIHWVKQHLCIISVLRCSGNHYMYVENICLEILFSQFSKRTREIQYYNILMCSSTKYPHPSNGRFLVEIPPPLWKFELISTLALKKFGFWDPPPNNFWWPSKGWVWIFLWNENPSWDGPGAKYLGDKIFWWNNLPELFISDYLLCSTPATNRMAHPTESTLAYQSKLLGT